MIRQLTGDVRDARCLRMGCRSSGSAPLLVDGVCPKCGTTQTAAVVPCTVLDPFSGAGTTLLVADRLGRDAIGIDLSPTYVDMARARLVDDCPLFTSFAPVETDSQDERMADLFREAAE